MLFGERTSPSNWAQCDLLSGALHLQGVAGLQMQLFPQRLGDHDATSFINDEACVHSGKILWVDPLVNTILHDRPGCVGAALNGRRLLNVTHMGPGRYKPMEARELVGFKLKQIDMHWIAPSEKDNGTTTLEKRLWAAADQFRANSGLTAAQYSQPVLGFFHLSAVR